MEDVRIFFLGGGTGVFPLLGFSNRDFFQQNLKRSAKKRSQALRIVMEQKLAKSCAVLAGWFS
jgi:hypothetical protein